MHGCGSHQANNRDHDFLAKGDYGLAILQLRSLESQRPNDSRIKRDLGIAYFKTGQIEKAIQKLEEAQRQSPRDLRTLFFLGISYEADHAYEQAASAYRKSLSLKTEPQFRQEILFRIAHFDSIRFQKEISKRFNELGDNHAAPYNSLAVLYFRNISKWQELDPVIKGLTELIISDLSAVQLLDVVPRKEVDALLSFLNFNTAQLYDQTKMTNAAALLGVRNIVTGGVERLDETTINITAGLVEAATGKLNGKGVSVTGNISDLLALEKKLLFDLLDDMHVKPRAGDLAKIKEPPTTDVLAFIAFCKGIYFQDLKQFDLSREQFEKALEHDPDFDLARRKLLQIPTKRLSNAEMERLLY